MLLWLLCGIVVVDISSQKEQIYNRQISYITNPLQGELNNGTSSSEIECARSCSGDKKCLNFNFNSLTKTCYTDSHTMVQTGSRIYTKEVKGFCPRTRGYDIFVPPANPICLKYYPIQLLQINASALCEGDGAHLVLIEDESMCTFLSDILTANNWGDVWVDGFDEDDDGKYETFRGKPLPYVPPGSRMKEFPGHRCVRLESQFGRFNDLPCDRTHSRKVLCQLDM